MILIFVVIEVSTRFSKFVGLVVTFRFEDVSWFQ